MGPGTLKLGLLGRLAQFASTYLRPPNLSLSAACCPWDFNPVSISLSQYPLRVLFSWPQLPCYPASHSNGRGSPSFMLSCNRCHDNLFSLRTISRHSELYGQKRGISFWSPSAKADSPLRDIRSMLQNLRYSLSNLTTPHFFSTFPPYLIPAWMKHGLFRQHGDL